MFVVRSGPGWRSVGAVFRGEEGVMGRHYRKEGYKCPYCDAIFPMPSSLGGHVTAKHTEADLDYILARKGYVKKKDSDGGQVAVSCPRCGKELENYSTVEGGWCPNCEEWFPSDVVEERLEEEE